MLKRALLLISLMFVATAASAESPSSGILEAALPFYWDHARPIATSERRAAVDPVSAPWRRVPDERWLRQNVSDYAADLIERFAALPHEDIALERAWFPGRVDQLDLSSYRLGSSYDWNALTADHPGVAAVIEIAPPVVSLDGRVAVVGYFSVEPEMRPSIYFSVVRKNAEGEWQLRGTLWRLDRTSASSQLGRPPR